MDINLLFDLLRNISGEKLLSVHEAYWQSDDASGQLLVSIRLEFEESKCLTIRAIDDDDSIEISDNTEIQFSKNVILMKDSRRWKHYLGRTVVWLRIMINNNGYFDGLQCEFWDENNTLQVQLLCSASELHMYACHSLY